MKNNGPTTFELAENGVMLHTLGIQVWSLFDSSWYVSKGSWGGSGSQPACRKPFVTPSFLKARFLRHEEAWRRDVTQRVQMSQYGVFRSQVACPQWLSEPHASIFAYLDPLGYRLATKCGGGRYGSCKRDPHQTCARQYLGHQVQAGQLTASLNEVTTDSSYCWEYANMGLNSGLEYTKTGLEFKD